MLLDRKIHIEKMTKLSDNIKFSKLINEKNKIEIIEKQLNEVLKRMKNDQVINKDIYERIKLIESIIPRLYGLSKIHKYGLPI